MLIAIPPTSDEQKKFKPGVLGQIFLFFHLHEMKLIFED
jgi:hypothetical protein